MNTTYCYIRLKFGTFKIRYIHNEVSIKMGDGWRCGTVSSSIEYVRCEKYYDRQNIHNKT